MSLRHIFKLEGNKETDDLVQTQERSVFSSLGTHTTHIPVMVKTGRLTGRMLHRDMTATSTASLQTTTHFYELNIFLKAFKSF